MDVDEPEDGHSSGNDVSDEGLSSGLDDGSDDEYVDEHAARQQVVGDQDQLQEEDPKEDALFQ